MPMRRLILLAATSSLVLAGCDFIRFPGDGGPTPETPQAGPVSPPGAPGPPPPTTPADDPYGNGDAANGPDPVSDDTLADTDPVTADTPSDSGDPGADAPDDANTSDADTPATDPQPVSPPPPPRTGLFLSCSWRAVARIWRGKQRTSRARP